VSVFVPFELPPRPAIPPRQVDIRDHGAQPGGDILNTLAIAAAIRSCSEQGGGRVVIPPGVWLTGPIHFRSHIELHLEAGAELRFSQDPADYLPVVYQQRAGIRCHNYSPFLYAHRHHDIALTGSGVLNGQGAAWWPWKQAQPGMSSLFQANALGTPVEERIYGTLEAGVRPPFFQAFDCKTILIEGVTFRDSPSWTIHPVWCDDLTIRAVTVLNPEKAPNTDGIDPDGCCNVLVEDCLVDTGDDGICLKSGRDRDAWESDRPCKNVLIRHCRVLSAHGGFVIGSEMSAGVHNVLVHDCEFDGSDVGIRIKTRAGRRGSVTHVQVERIAMRNIRREAIYVTLRYNGEQLEPAISTPVDVPLISEILLREIRCESADVALALEGLPGHPIRSVTLEDLALTARRGVVYEEVENLTTRRVAHLLPTNGKCDSP
jgi:polygalacturonase